MADEAIQVKVGVLDTRVTALERRTEKHEQQLADVAAQLNRIASQLESESGTLSRVTKDLKDRADAANESLRRMVDDLSDTVDGNGSLGLKGELAVVKKTVGDIKDSQKSTYRMAMSTFLAVAGTVVAGIIVWLITGGGGG